MWRGREGIGEGCREILTTEELKSSEEDDLWSNVDWLEDVMLELKPPEPLSSVSPETASTGRDSEREPE